MLGEIDSTVSVSSVPSLLEIDAILSAAKEDDMYFLIFSLACRAALPVSRILQINTNNMHMDGENIILIFDTDKDFGEPHYVRLPLDVTKLLNSYISNRIFPDNTGHVFYNKRNRPLTLQNLEVGARKYFAAAGLDGLYSLKDLKTRAIIDMKRAGVSSEIIAQYTGLSTSRITAYKRASAMYTECPADLANIQIKSERAADA